MTRHPLGDFRNPVTAVGHEDPLSATRFEVSVGGMLATVALSRTFRNGESTPIEATLVFPIPTAAVATGLTARIGGRVLSGAAQPKTEARATYEAAVDAGKAAVLHEEVVKGLHQVSVTNVGPGVEVEATIRYVIPLSFDPDPVLVLPTTVADVYGKWVGDEIDEPRTGSKVHRGTVAVTVASGGGAAAIEGHDGAEAEVQLNAPIVVRLSGHDAHPATGRLADGRAVRVAATPVAALLGEVPLDVDLLVDRSTSMQAVVGGRSRMRRVADGLAALEGFRADDRVRLHTFDTTYEFLGEARGSGVRALLARCPDVRGSTELGRALTAVLRAERPGRDVLVVTDGKTFALDHDEAAREGRRIHVLLVGHDAFDQGISYLAARTGGQVMITSGLSIERALVTALSSTLQPADAEREEGGERVLTVFRGGAAVEARIGAATGDGSPDEVGAYAASLLADRLDADRARELSVANGIVGAFTSLVLVDAEGAVQSATPVTRKSELSPIAGSSFDAFATQGFSPMRSMGLSSSVAASGAEPSTGGVFYAGRESKGILRSSPRFGAPRPPKDDASRSPFRSRMPATSADLGDAGAWITNGDLASGAQNWDAVSVDFDAMTVSGLSPETAAEVERHAQAIVAAGIGDLPKARAAVTCVLARRFGGRTGARIARRGAGALGEAIVRAAERMIDGLSVAA